MICSCKPEGRLLICGVNRQIPPADGGLLAQRVPEKNHGRVFGGKVTGVQKPQTGVFSPAGHRMLDLGGEKDVCSLVQGGFRKVGTGAAAESDGRHPVGPWPGFQYPRRSAG